MCEYDCVCSHACMWLCIYSLCWRWPCAGHSSSCTSLALTPKPPVPQAPCPPIPLSPKPPIRHPSSPWTSCHPVPERNSFGEPASRNCWRGRGLSLSLLCFLLLLLLLFNSGCERYLMYQKQFVQTSFYRWRAAALPGPPLDCC